MKASIVISLIFGALVPSVLGQSATLVGRVDLPKTTTAAVMAKRYEIVSKAGVLAPNPPVAIVYLEGRFPAATNLPVRQIIQTNYTFVPALLPVQVGTKVEFPNRDDAFHNIFSFSPAKRFDLGRYRPEERPIPSQVLDKAGLVTLRCDIHEHMRALILVIETPYFVTTDPTGSFKLERLPAGNYLLKAWINSRTTLEQPVSLENGKSATVNFVKGDRPSKDSPK